MGIPVSEIGILSKVYAFGQIIIKILRKSDVTLHTNILSQKIITKYID